MARSPNAKQLVEFVRDYPLQPPYRLVHFEAYPSDQVRLLAQIRYAATTHYLLLLRLANGLHWLLLPYRDSYFSIRAADCPSYLIALEAVRDHYYHVIL